MASKRTILIPEISSAPRTVSNLFRDHVRFLYDLSFSANVRSGENGLWATRYAIPAYLSAAASVEAFVNESFLSEFAHRGTSKSRVWTWSQEKWQSFEKTPLLDKIVLLPKYAYGKTLKRGEQPFLDLRMLFSLRNGLTHYKFRIHRQVVEQDVDELSRRGIAFKKPKGIALAWLDRVSTTEGIRWAHNCIIQTVKALVQLMPDESQPDTHYNVYMTKHLKFIGPDAWKKLVPSSSVSK